MTTTAVVDLRDSLRQLLDESPSEARARAESLFEREAGSSDLPLVLCGAGALGRTMLRALRSARIEPLAFVDNNASRWNTKFEGLDVLSPEIAVERFGKSAAFAITVFTCRPLERQMRALGARTCSTRAVFFRYLPNLVPHYGIDWPDTLLAARDEVLAGYDVWADDVSRAEYVRQVRWQLALDAHPGESWPVAETYFPPDLVRFSDDDVFIDCGAFDGDTLRMVIDRRGDRFARFIGVEPDPENRARFEAYRATLAPALQSKISMVPAAIGAEPGVVRFQAEAWAGSKIADGGTVAVNVETIDRIASGTRPTFIKVDIEGAEPNAVEGGARVLSQDAPFVAICLYHAQWHLWRVPMRIRELNDDYELHLRRYSDDCWELVCYAAPHAS